MQVSFLLMQQIAQLFLVLALHLESGSFLLSLRMSKKLSRILISIGKTDDTSFIGWFCGAIRFFAQIAFFRGLIASELSHKVHFPCCTRTDTPPNSSDFLPIFYANYCKKFKISLKRF